MTDNHTPEETNSFLSTSIDVNKFESMPSEQDFLDLFDWMSNEWNANHDFELPMEVFASAVLNTWGNVKRFKPIKAIDRLPMGNDLESKVNYCWWWNKDTVSWLYCDARKCDYFIYTHWLPYGAFPIPSH